MTTRDLILSSLLSNRRNYRGTNVAPTAPAFSTTPAIVGIPTVGIPTTYTPGIVTGNPTPTVTRQWNLNGTPISGAIGVTYTPISGDSGGSLTITETATNGVGAPAVSTSSPVTVQTSSLPSWVTSAPLNAWVAIPGTAGCGGAVVDPWGGFPIRDDGNGIVQIAFLAAGGHTNSSDNRVVSCDLNVNSPTWTTRVTTSPTPYVSTSGNASQTVFDYYSYDVTPGDNPKPGSSHLYDYIAWSKYAQKYIRISATGTYVDGGTSACVDTIAPIDTGGGIWHWDAPGTNPLFPFTGNGASQARGNPNDGYIWCSGFKWRPGQGSWTTQTIFQQNGNPWRFPFSYDIGRDCIFNLQIGDGQDVGTSLISRQTFLTAGTNRSITFNAGPGLTKILADKPDYAGMDYDTFNGYYLFMYDRNDVVNIQGLLKVTPDPGGTAVWDMSIFTLGGGGITPGRTPTDGSGVNGRFKYSPTLGGFIYISKASDGAYFLRTK